MRCHLLDRPCGIEPANDRKPPLGARIQKVLRFKVRLRADGHGHIEVVANSHAEEVRRRDADDIHGLSLSISF